MTGVSFAEMTGVSFAEMTGVSFRGPFGGAENANRPEVIRAVSSSETLGRSSYFALLTTKNLQLAVTPLPSLTWTSYLPRALIG